MTSFTKDLITTGGTVSANRYQHGYTFNLDSTRLIDQLVIPNYNDMRVLGITLVP